MWHIVSFCSSWLAAQRAAVSSVISQKWEMQLKWQVAASSCYDNWKEMCGVTSSGASTAARWPSPERTGSTSGGLKLCLCPIGGCDFLFYLICKSTEKFNSETIRFSRVHWAEMWVGTVRAWYVMSQHNPVLIQYRWCLSPSISGTQLEPGSAQVIAGRDINISSWSRQHSKSPFQLSM